MGPAKSGLWENIQYRGQVIVRAVHPSVCRSTCLDRPFLFFGLVCWQNFRTSCSSSFTFTEPGREGRRVTHLCTSYILKVLLLLCCGTIFFVPLDCSSISDHHIRPLRDPAIRLCANRCNNDGAQQRGVKTRPTSMSPISKHTHICTHTLSPTHLYCRSVRRRRPNDQ